MRDAFDLSFNILKKRAEQGDAQMQWELGSYYAHKDNTESMKWLRKAAEQASPSYSSIYPIRAQYEIGEAYANGRGVAKDYAEAFRWFRKAAEIDRRALGWVSRCYAEGLGVSQDLVEAAAYLFVYIHSNHHVSGVIGYDTRFGEMPCKLRLDDLCNQLTDWQMQSSQNRAKEILAKFELATQRYLASPEAVQKRTDAKRYPNSGDGYLR